MAIRILKILSAVGLCSFLLTQAACSESTRSEADSAKPEPAETARATVQLQLDALQANNQPSPDSGIQTAWDYAHPKNRAATGPIERFTEMVKGPAYRPLLEHDSSRISLVHAAENRVTFEVVVFPRGNSAPLRYVWTVEKVAMGPRTGEWATTAVYPPVQDGSPPA